MGKRKVLFFLLTVFAVMLTLNIFTPESVQDDYAYKFAWQAPENTGEVIKITSIGDVIKSQYHHYVNLNGRMMPHFLLQVFDGVTGKWLFNVLSSIVFCLLICLICKLAVGKIRVHNLSISIFLIILLCPLPKETIFWFAGSVNYLWSVTGGLFFIYLMKEIGDKNLSLKYILLSPFIIFLGWVNESTVIPICLVFGILMLFSFKTDYKKAKLLFLLFFVLGVSLSVFSPSTLAKVGTNEEVGMLKEILQRTKTLIAALLELRIFWIYVIVSLWLFIYKREWLQTHAKTHKAIVLLPFVSLLIFFLADVHYARVRFATEIYSLVAFIGMISYFPNVKFHRAVWVLNTISIFFIIPLLYYSYHNWRNWKVCEKQLKEPGKELILTERDDIPAFFDSYIMRHVDYAKREIWYFACKEVDMVSEYYNKKNVRYLPKALYQDILTRPEWYKDFREAPDNIAFYVKEISSYKEIKSITFELSKTNQEDIPLWLYPFSQYMSKYTISSDKPRDFTTMQINNRTYLIMTQPLIKEINMRVKNILVEF